MLVQDITLINYNSEFDFVFARKMLYYLPGSKVKIAFQNLKRALINIDDESNLIIDSYSKKTLKKQIGSINM